MGRNNFFPGGAFFESQEGQRLGLRQASGSATRRLFVTLVLPVVVRKALLKVTRQQLRRVGVLLLTKSHEFIKLLPVEFIEQPVFIGSFENHATEIATVMVEGHF